jgi:predicted dehydrogenase
MKINVAIVGLGVVGKKRREFIKNNKSYNLIAVSDVLFKKDFIRNKVRYFKNFEDIFKMTIKLDAIFITLPNYLSSKVTILALKKNIHVFCEKPPAKNYEELLKVKKYLNNKTKLKYGFNHRYHGSIKFAKKIIDSKKLGGILNVRSLYGKSKILTYTKSDWRSKKKYAGGGILTDQGIHMLDLLRFFCGNFEEYKSFVSNKYWKFDIEDDVFAILRNKKVTASIHSTALQWEHKFRMEISLEKGSIILDGILSGSKTYGQERIQILEKKNNNLFDRKKFYFKKDKSWQEEVDEFANIIKYNKDVKIGNLNDALSVMKMISKIYKNDNQWKL